jgi:hypothetical protein
MSPSAQRLRLIRCIFRRKLLIVSTTVRARTEALKTVASPTKEIKTSPASGPSTTHHFGVCMPSRQDSIQTYEPGFPAAARTTSACPQKWPKGTLELCRSYSLDDRFRCGRNSVQHCLRSHRRGSSSCKRAKTSPSPVCAIQHDGYDAVCSPLPGRAPEKSAP